MYQSMLFKLLRCVTFIWSNIRGEKERERWAGWHPEGLVWASGAGRGTSPSAQTRGPRWGSLILGVSLRGRLPFAPPLSPQPVFRGRHGEGPHGGLVMPGPPHLDSHTWTTAPGALAAASAHRITKSGVSAPPRGLWRLHPGGAPLQTPVLGAPGFRPGAGGAGRGLQSPCI